MQCLKAHINKRQVVDQLNELFALKLAAASANDREHQYELFECLPWPSDDAFVSARGMISWVGYEAIQFAGHRLTSSHSESERAYWLETRQAAFILLNRF